jgi:hypothetical protein
MYDSKVISDYYDRYGAKEWERLDLTFYDRINYHLHMHSLREYIGQDKRILDAGCGA